MKKPPRYYALWHSKYFLEILKPMRICIFLLLLAMIPETVSAVVSEKQDNSLPQAADEVVIKGTVKEKSGETLPGVSVMVKGTTIGAAADIDGKFELRAPRQGKIILVFSFMGMKTQEIEYKGQQHLTVVMAEDIAQLEEVVVTGYQKIDRRLFTGSADVVKAEDLKTDGANDVSRMLQGKS